MDFAFPKFAQAMRQSLVVLPIGVSLLLTSCSKDPESAGKKIADAYCESVNKNYTPHYEAQKTLVEELKAGKITTYSQFNARTLELARPIQVNDSTDAAKLKSLITQSQVDFPKEEDRTTMTNTLQAHIKQCDEERAPKTKAAKDLEAQVLQLKSKLSFK